MNYALPARTAIALCLVVLLLPLTALHAQDDARQKPEAAAPQQNQNTSSQPLTVRITGPVRLEREKEIEPDWSRLKCEEAKSHDEADLCEQRRMAEAAEQTVLLNKIQTLVGFVGFALVAWNLWYVRQTTLAAIQATKITGESAATSAQAAEAAIAAAKEARQQNEVMLAAQRAFLSIVDVQVSRLAYEDGPLAEVEYTIVNNGTTTAMNVRSRTQFVLSPKAQQDRLGGFGKCIAEGLPIPGHLRREKAELWRPERGEIIPPGHRRLMRRTAWMTAEGVGGDMGLMVVAVYDIIGGEAHHTVGVQYASEALTNFPSSRSPLWKRDVDLELVAETAD